MKKKLLKILICGILALGVTGCNNNNGVISTPKSNESLMIGHTLDDGRVVHLTFDVPYNDNYLTEALMNDEISIDDFIDKLEYVSGLNDGGSKLYRYSSAKQIFGNEDFYVLACNSLDGIKDIFVAKNTNSLADKCIIKIDDLDNVSMIIKEGTLTKESATVLIKDISNRDNIYGKWYRIDKLENGLWTELNPITENYGFILIGYSVDANNNLELTHNWKSLYGELKPGKYRIVKSTSEAGEATKHYITAEFEIE